VSLNRNGKVEYFMRRRPSTQNKPQEASPA
jgi:hypothetical protein